MFLFLHFFRGDTNPFFQVDLGYADEIKGVATQGQEANYWLVRKFTLSFSLDGATWFNYTANGLGTKVRKKEKKPLDFVGRSIFNKLLSIY